MSKLIAAYRANPSLSNALKLYAYERKHRMAVCMLSQEEMVWLNEAIVKATS